MSSHDAPPDPAGSPPGPPVPCPTGFDPAPFSTPWSLITAADELTRCCVVTDQRCAHVVRWRCASPSGADDYTHVCACHLELVRRPDDRVTPVAPGAVAAARPPGDGDGGPGR